MIQTKGIHHISAIVGHPQENVDFYAGILGLRLVKQTVNFDDPGTYHFYFGDEAGTPGTLMTVFPWPNAYRGTIGDGQVGVTIFMVPYGSLIKWEQRLQAFNVPYQKQTRFDQTYLQFNDPHGLQLELAESDAGEPNHWQFNGTTPDMAIKGFYGAVLYSSEPEETANLLQKMGFQLTAEDDLYIRLTTDADLGNVIDIKKARTGTGRMGVGTVHHIAFRSNNNDEQAIWHEQIKKMGYYITPLKDRKYFTSLYFREKGKVLFEIATDEPGFMVDEPRDQLGEVLQLPPQYEPHREALEKVLVPFEVREVKKMK